MRSRSNGDSRADVKSSYFVGDAAGRSGDHSDGDKGFAKAVGLPFFTPEVRHLRVQDDRRIADLFQISPAILPRYQAQVKGRALAIWKW